jgi:hypothetical protein
MDEAVPSADFRLPRLLYYFTVWKGSSSLRRAAQLDRTERLVLDSDLRRKMGEASVRRVARYTPEHGAQRFEEAIFYLLTSPGDPTE